jgi:hypothetical protein
MKPQKVTAALLTFLSLCLLKTRQSLLPFRCRAGRKVVTVKLIGRANSMLERYFRVICAIFLRVGATRRSELVAATKVKTLCSALVSATALSTLFIYLQAHSAGSFVDCRAEFCSMRVWRGIHVHVNGRTALFASKQVSSVSVCGRTSSPTVCPRCSLERAISSFLIRNSIALKKTSKNSLHNLSANH